MNHLKLVKPRRTNQLNPYMLQVALDIRMMTVKELAEQSGVSPAFVQAFLDGQSPLFGEAELVEKWADLLHFLPGFFYREGERAQSFMCGSGGCHITEPNPQR